MDLNVFDPNVHRIVAVVADGPEKGTHVHVTLHELALDTANLQIPAPVDIGPLERDIAKLSLKIEAVEAKTYKPDSVPAVYIPNEPPMSDPRISDLENQIERLKSELKAAHARVDDCERHIVAAMRDTQALLQALADNSTKIEFILDHGVSIDGTQTLRKVG